MRSRLFGRPTPLGCAQVDVRLSTTPADGQSHWWPRSGREPIYAQVWATHRARLVAGLLGTPLGSVHDDEGDAQDDEDVPMFTIGIRLPDEPEEEEGP